MTSDWPLMKKDGLPAVWMIFMSQEFYFKKPGNYTFAIEQIMREDPLKNILNAGLRIEKKQ